ncbi:alpha-L-arabinofuranosidase C-terminal domain-containing protein [Roseateles asaccharophilus]|uniref:non-reducing end alpha-L-arabinofuranosidase n=1 Tax=Roseateles asaccharophilus TaxID=582607 RepID=A0ABU2ABV2_9BURK|nr:alpha-L-arabinofuranosidase C-terminal domain-containing protein [Roseateles asaccharophilus]MDR7333468.1 alpha-N-arabinofuranosidase [Roseateles asaccharophilus]
MKKQLLALVATLVVGAGVHAADIKVVVSADQPGPVIHRNIYGQFAEHLGTGIYEGMWVGPESKIPNVRGWRKDVVAALKDLKVPLVRWPGGCFADEYHWRDGIGPRNKRPVKVNTHWGGVPENNAVGTHEFFDLVEQLGAEAYVNANMGTGTPQEAAEWLEYMTGEGNATIVEQRRKNGRDKPFRVHYYALGNETWGCGGNMRPEYYADLYRHWATFLKTPAHNRPKFIASGGNDKDTTWTDVLSKQVKHNIDAIAHHAYTFPSGKWEGKGSAAGFPESEWVSMLSQVKKIDDVLAASKVILDKNDPQKKIALYFDEWGSWYDPEPGSNPGFLVQRNTLRDALLAALHFNVFHSHAERVQMSNVAQMVNVLQAMILTSKDKLVLTPTYHAFKLYIPFQDATSLPIKVENNPTYKVDKFEMPTVSVTAGRGKDGKVWVGLVNSNATKPAELDLQLGANAPKAVKGQVLTASAMDAQNELGKAPQVVPTAFEAQATNGKLTLKLPAKSIVVVAVEG